MKYMIVKNEKYRESLIDSVAELEEKVNKLIGIGWKPIGSVEISGDTYGQFLLQAMTLEEEKVTPITKNKTAAKLAVERAKKRIQKKENKL